MVDLFIFQMSKINLFSTVPYEHTVIVHVPNHIGVVHLGAVLYP